MRHGSNFWPGACWHLVRGFIVHLSERPLSSQLYFLARRPLALRARVNVLARRPLAFGARLLASSDRRVQDDGWFDWDVLDEIEAHACPTSDPKLRRKERGGGRAEVS